MPMFAGKYISEEDFARFKKKISSIEFTEEDRKQIQEAYDLVSSGQDEESIAERKRFNDGMPKVPDEDKEYLHKKLSSLPPDHVFTDEELDEIATKGFPGIEKVAYMKAYDTGDPNAFDKRERLKNKTDEEIIIFCERYAGKNHDAPIFENFYNLCMGHISSREYYHDINKRDVITKFKVIHKLR